MGKGRKKYGWMDYTEGRKIAFKGMFYSIINK